YWSENRHWPSPGPKPTDRIELVAERGTDPSPPLDAVGITGRDNGTAGKLGSAREHTPSTHHTPHCSITKENPWQCRLLLASPPRSRPPSGHGHEPPGDRSPPATRTSAAGSGGPARTATWWTLSPPDTSSWRPRAPSITSASPQAPPRGTREG